METEGEDATKPSTAPLVCTSHASFWSPNYVVLSAWFEHAPFLFWLIDAFRPQSFVELGSHSGYSFFAACEAVVRCRLPTKCHAIDTWQGDDHAGFYDDSVYRSVCAEHERAYASFATLHRATFDDALDRFEDGSIDLLHIDGRHGYEDVRHDFESWLPKVSRRGVVMFHDTQVRERGFGVHQFWGELESRYPSFSFVHGNGLGIAFVGKDLDAAIAPLFYADLRTKDALREAYSRLGSTISERFQLDAHKVAQAQYVRDLASLHAEIERCRAEIQELRADVARESEQARSLGLDLAATRAELDGSRQLGAAAVRQYVRVRHEVDELRASIPGWISESAEKATSRMPRVVAAGLERTISAAQARTRAKLTAQELREADEIAVVASSEFFDAQWYYATNLDVLESGSSAAQHYVRSGAAEGRDPGPAFSTRAYLASNPDVAESRQNALVHYERFGRREGRALPTM